MNDVFKFEQQEEGERELVLLVGPRGPLPHQRYATHSDIKAALAEKELCVVPKGRHDWVFAEEVMKRDEEIARLTAQLTAEQQRRQEVERRECLDHQEIAEALGILEQLPDQAGVVAEIVRLRAELASLRKVVEHLTGIVARLGDWSVRYGSDLVPPGRDTYGEGVRACKVHVRGILASASNEAIGEDGSAVERDDETVRGFDSRSAHPVASLDESSPVAEPSKPANPGELSANPPNHPAESSNPSKSSNGSANPVCSTCTEQSEDTEIVRAVTAVVRAADRAFEKSGGTSRHWVRDWFLPYLNDAGLMIARCNAPELAATLASEQSGGQIRATTVTNPPGIPESSGEDARSVEVECLGERVCSECGRTVEREWFCVSCYEAARREQPSGVLAPDARSPLPWAYERHSNHRFILFDGGEDNGGEIGYVGETVTEQDAAFIVARCNAPATVPRGALPEWRITRVRGATAFLREAWEHNDGAEGESVRLVCDELEALLDAGTR